MLGHQSSKKSTTLSSVCYWKVVAENQPQAQTANRENGSFDSVNNRHEMVNPPMRTTSFLGTSANCYPAVYTREHETSSGLLQILQCSRWNPYTTQNEETN